jgi:hypothetical protein
MINVYTQLKQAIFLFSVTHFYYRCDTAQFLNMPIESHAESSIKNF